MEQVFLVVGVVLDDIHGPDLYRGPVVVQQPYEVSPVPMRIREKLDLKLLDFRPSCTIVRQVMVVTVPVL